mgnify:CR=1 FL=1
MHRRHARPAVARISHGAAARVAGDDVRCLRRAAKRDDNEAEIVSALERCGATVERLSGADLPDLLVGFRGLNVLMEVKQEAGARGGTSHKELLPGQIEWHTGWKGARPVVVRTVEEALAAIGVSVVERSQGEIIAAAVRAGPRR